MQVIMSLGLRVGATIVTMARFDLEEFLRILQDYRITRAELVPPIMLALAKHPLVDRYDLSSLEVIMSAAAALGSDVSDACVACLGCAVKQGHGMTELSPATHITLDGAGEEVGVGERGEVCMRGPQAMRGYLNDPDATARTVDAEGWLHTGDIGYADEDGYLCIVDRVKELIKYKGYQVAPAELEAVLLSHPAVIDAAVVASFDQIAGEVLKAYVVLNAMASPDEILAFVAERVAPYTKIRALEFIEAIPKSASGKILRRLLIERDQAAALQRH